jgi:hypothetical protein
LIPYRSYDQYLRIKEKGSGFSFWERSICLHLKYFIFAFQASGRYAPGAAMSHNFSFFFGNFSSVSYNKAKNGVSSRR